MTGTAAPRARVALSPYARTLGIVVDAGDADMAAAPLLRLPAGDTLLGRPGFLHGGAIAGLLEAAAYAALDAAAGDTPAPAAAILTMTVDYLRGARLVPTFAQGRVIRAGARIAAVEVSAWQDDRARPVATARLNLSVTR